MHRNMMKCINMFTNKHDMLSNKGGMSLEVSNQNLSPCTVRLDAKLPMSK